MHTKIFLNLFTVYLLQASLLTLPAQAAETANIAQLTNTLSNNLAFNDSTNPDVSADGSTVVFNSTADIVPGGNTGNVNNLYAMNNDGTALRQLTFISNDAGEARNARLSGDGKLLVFESSANLTGENPPEVIDLGYATLEVRNYQIFIMNIDGTSLQQLTHGTGGSASVPQISDDGSIVAFQSNQDLTGENADNTEEIFVIHADGTNLMQITVGAPKPENSNKRDDASRDPSLSADGSTIAFDSFVDLVPPLNDDLSDEIFIFDLKGYMTFGGNRLDYTRQLTDTDIDDPAHTRAEDAFEAHLSANGNWVTFSACINPLFDPDTGNEGTNSFLADQIFVIKRDGTGLRQLTFGDDVDDDNHWPSISANGKFVVYGSRAQAGENTHMTYELYAAATNGSWVKKLTDGSTGVGKIRPAISARGEQILFHSETDFVGDNSDENMEIFSIERTIPPNKKDRTKRKKKNLYQF